MKKILSLLIQVALISNLSFSVIACYNPFTKNGDLETPNPTNPIIKDIPYYQKLIKETERYINDCKQELEDIKNEQKNDKEGNISDEEYQLEFDQVSVELYLYQSDINEYQYQILLLEKKDQKFTVKQILQGLATATEKIINLEQALKLKEKYQADYPEKEIKKLKDDIKKTIEIKEMFLKLKEEEDNKCDK